MSSSQFEECLARIARTANATEAAELAVLGVICCAQCTVGPVKAAEIAVCRVVGRFPVEAAVVRKADRKHAIVELALERGAFVLRELLALLHVLEPLEPS